MEKTKLVWITALLVLISAINIITLNETAHSNPIINPDIWQSAEIRINPEPEIDTGLDAGFIQFEATAYCDLGITFSGVYVQRGIVAGDPRILPIGSVIEVKAGGYSGIFVVLDTGRLIKGRIIDLFLPEYEEAIQFGRQQVSVKVIRYGWRPEKTIAENFPDHLNVSD